MLKKIIAITLIATCIFLGIFLFMRNRSGLSQTHQSDRRQKPIADTFSSSPSSQETNHPTQIESSTLTDTKKSPNERAALILKWKKSLGTINQVDELVIFINTDNPYLKKNEVMDPHSFNSYQFQKEASLRVLAIKVLSEQLSLDEFSEVVASIQKSSNDKSIKRVAKQAFEFKKDGRNYFKEMKKAIQESPLPEHS